MSSLVSGLVGKVQSLLKNEPVRVAFNGVTLVVLGYLFSTGKISLSTENEVKAVLALLLSGGAGELVRSRVTPV